MTVPVEQKACFRSVGPRCVKHDALGIADVAHEGEAAEQLEAGRYPNFIGPLLFEQVEQFLKFHSSIALLAHADEDAQYRVGTL